MIRRILAAYDGSPAAASALSVSASLAGITDAEFIGLFVEDDRRLVSSSLGVAIAQSLVGEAVVPQPVAPEKALEVEEQLEEQALKVYRQFQEQCARSKVEGRFLSLRGAPEEIIAQRSKTVDLVVVGGIERDADKDFQHAGVTVNGLLRRVAVPVLVVPQDIQGESGLVIAYDGSLASERVLRVAAEMAEISHLDVVYLLTVGPDVESARTVQSPAVEYLSAFDFETRGLVEVGRPADAIVKVVDQVDASFVALGAFGANRIKELLFGSTTAHVVQNAQAAVLLVA